MMKCSRSKSYKVLLQLTCSCEFRSSFRLLCCFIFQEISLELKQQRPNNCSTNVSRCRSKYISVGMLMRLCWSRKTIKLNGMELENLQIRFSSIKRYWSQLLRRRNSSAWHKRDSDIVTSRSLEITFLEEISHSYIYFAL